MVTCSKASNSYWHVLCFWTKETFHNEGQARACRHFIQENAPECRPTDVRVDACIPTSTAKSQHDMAKRCICLPRPLVAAILVTATCSQMQKV